jgi:hypothetical protein
MFYNSKYNFWIYLEEKNGENESTSQKDALFRFSDEIQNRILDFINKKIK